MSRARPVVFFATASGGEALDQADAGGNPFAGAVIDMLDRPSVTLAAFARGLARRTRERSHGFQRPPATAISAALAGSTVSETVSEPTTGARGAALVLMFSAYRGARLDGAELDAARLASAFVRARFDTLAIVDPPRARIRRILRDFGTRSQAVGTSAIYCTGHGLELPDGVHVLMGLPERWTDAAVRRVALPVDDIAGAARAARLNLVFFGGCRSHAPAGRLAPGESGG